MKRALVLGVVFLAAAGAAAGLLLWRSQAVRTTEAPPPNPRVKAALDRVDARMAGLRAVLDRIARTDFKAEGVLQLPSPLEAWADDVAWDARTREVDELKRVAVRPVRTWSASDRELLEWACRQQMAHFDALNQAYEPWLAQTDLEREMQDALLQAHRAYALACGALLKAARAELDALARDD